MGRAAGDRKLLKAAGGGTPTTRTLVGSKQEGKVRVAVGGLKEVRLRRTPFLMSGSAPHYRAAPEGPAACWCSMEEWFVVRWGGGNGFVRVRVRGG